jgi:hypothetical protein
MKSFVCVEEQPWRDHVGTPGLTLRAGLELRHADITLDLRRDFLNKLLEFQYADINACLPALGEQLQLAFPGRAFWVEIGLDDFWYQLYEHGGKA